MDWRFFKHNESGSRLSFAISFAYDQTFRHASIRRKRHWTYYRCQQLIPKLGSHRILLTECGISAKMIPLEVVKGITIASIPPSDSFLSASARKIEASPRIAVGYRTRW